MNPLANGKEKFNNDILLILERGIREEVRDLCHIKKNISKNTQIHIWIRLSKEWQDDRTTEEIIDDIYQSRTLGREFQL